MRFSGAKKCAYICVQKNNNENKKEKKDLVLACRNNIVKMQKNIISLNKSQFICA